MFIHRRVISKYIKNSSEYKFEYKTCFVFEFAMDSCILSVLIRIISRYEYETGFLKSSQVVAGAVT